MIDRESETWKINQEREGGIERGKSIENHHLRWWWLMMPKSSPVRCTILALAAVPTRENDTKTPSEGTDVEPTKHPPKVKSEKLCNSRVLERS